MLEGHLQVVRNQLGDPVHVAVAHVQGPAHVAHDRLGPHGPEGDDLADLVAAVLVDHVLDHLGAAVLAEVHVDIRHGDTFRVEEALEEQVVGEGVEVGDLGGVGHQRTGGRTPARADRDAAVLGPADEVRHDQEVGRELHLPDAVQFDCQAVEVGLLLFQRHVGILGQDGDHPLLEPFGGQLPQHVIVVLPGGRVEVREVVGLAVHRQLQVAAFGDGQGVADRLGGIVEGGGHLLRRLDVELVHRELHVGRVAHGLAGLDAEQHLVGAGILPVQVVAVVGGHQRQLQLGGHLHQALVDDVLLRDGVLLQLDIVAPGEQLAVPAGGGDGILHPAAAALHGHLALEAGRHGDQPLGAPREQFAVDAGPVVEALLVAGRGQVGQVLVALHVLAEQDQVVGRVGDALGVLGKARLRRQVELAADDRLDAGLLALQVELGGAEHVAVVGHGHRRHVQFLGLGDQVVEADGAVQQGILGVEVEVDEIG